MLTFNLNHGLQRCCGLLQAFLLAFALSGETSSTAPNDPDQFAAPLEREIRSGAKHTYSLIVPYHPRIWAWGEQEWDPQSTGTIAWRIVHGTLVNPSGAENDQSKQEFYQVAEIPDYIMGVVADQSDQEFGRRFLWTTLAGHARRYGWDQSLPGSLNPYSSKTYNPQNNADQYYADARLKLLGMKNISKFYEWAYYICVYGSVAYDWLLPLKFSDGNPVLSEQDKTDLQNLLFENGDLLRDWADGNGHFFADRDLAGYVYFMVGLALYEPSRVDDPGYKEINAKARLYLDEFDTQWVGKILPALNAQGGDGGWHGGFAFMSEFLESYYSNKTVIPWQIAPLLFAHYTATGEPIERSLFSTGVVKNSVLFQNYMIRPSGYYYPPLPEEDARMPWVGPMRLYARRRFSTDDEQRRIAELGAWLRAVASPSWFVNEGSWDSFDQLIFEDKWVNPRSPAELGFPLSHWFRQLGWVFMRSGFTSREDLAALFVCERFRWSEMDPTSQNNFTLDYMGSLIEGYHNTVLVNGEPQRSITDFPAINEGLEAFSPGSSYDIGPGVVKFSSGSDYDFICGDATHAYTANHVERAIRSIAYLKNIRTFIVYDHIITRADNAPCSWIINPGGNPELIGADLMRIGNGKADLWAKRLFPEAGTIITANADKYEWRAESSAKEIEFLHVLQPSKTGLESSSPAVIADDARLSNVNGVIGCQIGEWHVLFNDTSMAVVSGPTGVKTGAVTPPAGFFLNQNYPNPFNGSTSIAFSLTEAMEVDLAIYDLKGRCQITLMHGLADSGQHQIRWDGKTRNGTSVSSGVYFCILRSDRRQLIRKLLLLQ